MWKSSIGREYVTVISALEMDDASCLSSILIFCPIRSLRLTHACLGRTLSADGRSRAGFG
jgi:hypothetical protein